MKYLLIAVFAAVFFQAACAEGKLDLDACINRAGDPIPQSYCELLREREAKRQAKARMAAEEEARTAALPPAKPTVLPIETGQHLWSWHEGDRYGYRREPSPEDRFRGITTLPLFTVSARLQGAVWTFVTSEPQSPLMSCRLPCDVMQIITLGVGPEIVPVAPGSVLWAVVQDAKHGHLKF